MEREREKRAVGRERVRKEASASSSREERRERERGDEKQSAGVFRVARPAVRRPNRTTRTTTPARGWEIAPGVGNSGVGGPPHWQASAAGTVPDAGELAAVRATGAHRGH